MVHKQHDKSRRSFKGYIETFGDFIDILDDTLKAYEQEVFLVTHIFL